MAPAACSLPPAFACAAVQLGAQMLSVPARLLTRDILSLMFVMHSPRGTRSISTSEISLQQTIAGQRGWHSSKAARTAARFNCAHTGLSRL